jgi:hypothetical protein
MLRYIFTRAFFFVLSASQATLLTLAGLSSTAADAVTTSAAATPSARYALSPPAARFTVESQGVDRARELAADAARPKSLPIRYAVVHSIAGAVFRDARAQGGEWRDLPDGMALWRIPLHAPNALTLDFGFRRFFLPPGAQLFIHNGSQVLGPYSESDNPRAGEFWTPLINGERAQIEVLLPQAMKRFLELDLGTLHAGYRDIFAAKSFHDPNVGSGACNLDTICPQGDSWRSEINAEAVLVSNGTFCSGQLVNNTRGDHAALLTTAHHCYSTASDGNGLVLYWKYESPTCRAVGSSEDAQPVPTTSAITQTGGATLLATDHDSDFSLFQLNSAPPAQANAYFNGWDRGDTTFSNAIAIHHPGADAKRLSFTADSIVVDNTDYGLDSSGEELVPGLYHWRVDHYAIGTTEGGSSGGGLLDANHRLRGVLSGGSASCSETDGYDEYGRVSQAWIGGGTPASRLQDWLDPTASGVSQIDGVASCSAPTVNLSLSANPINAGDKITLSASASGGVAPYTYAFDVDGDGIADSTDPSQASIPAVYSGAYSGNVSVSVTDSAGCSGHASKALIVQAPQIVLAPLPLPLPAPLCGGTSATLTINPGQRWRQQVGLTNSGNSASQAGYAIFAQDPATLSQTKLTLETSAAALPALAPGQTAIVNLDYAIDATNTCGAAVKINLLGAADGRSFSASSATVVNGVIDASCQAVTTCPAVTTPRQLDPGSYYDALRAGSGMTLAAIAQGSNDPMFFGLWFTGDAARQPIWYEVQAPLHANQANSPLYKTQQSATMPQWPARPVSIGSAQITLVDADKFVFTWNFNGNAGGALYTPVTALASVVRILYYPAESGWGLYNQAVATGPGQELSVTWTYLYDAAGNPRWIESAGSSPSENSQSAFVVRPTCPGCVWLDYNAGKQSAGTLIYGGSGSDVQVSTNLFFPTAIPGSWTRSALPLTPLYISP